MSLGLTKGYNLPRFTLFGLRTKRTAISLVESCVTGRVKSELSLAVVDALFGTSFLVLLQILAHRTEFLASITHGNPDKTNIL